MVVNGGCFSVGDGCYSASMAVNDGCWSILFLTAAAAQRQKQAMAAAPVTDCAARRQ